MKWKEIDLSYGNQIEKLRQQSAHERLGLQVGATMADVKKAYRKKVSLYHSDRTDRFMTEYGEEMTKLLNSAFEEIQANYSK